MSNQMTTEAGTFTIGERVIYSDLSPWELAEIVNFKNNYVTLRFAGESDPLEECMPCGMRKLTTTNYKKYMDAESQEKYPAEELDENLAEYIYTDEEYAELLA